MLYSAFRRPISQAWLNNLWHPVLPRRLSFYYAVSMTTFIRQVTLQISMLSKFSKSHLFRKPGIVFFGPFHARNCNKPKLISLFLQIMTNNSSSSIPIIESADKRSITGTFIITLSGEFLPMQLIYGGKTVQGLPRFKYPDTFVLVLILSTIVTTKKNHSK